jgi:serine/threonine protein phosphatase 1
MTGRLFAIGDIHGCAAELETLVAALPLAAGDTLLFVGDYLDRGPDSRRVVDFLLALRRREDVTTVFLKGNHEDMCLGYFGRCGRWGESWQQNGGMATLRSYGIDVRQPGPEAVASMPPPHLEFLETLVPSHFAGAYLFVHAGIRPDRPWAEQDEEDLLWIREEFIVPPHRLAQTIVFGHTPQRHVYVQLPYKIGIDTGCVYGGMLTCVELTEGVLHQVRLGEQRVRQGALVSGPRAGANRST